jgi:hypothetical protein
MPSKQFGNMCAVFGTQSTVIALDKLRLDLQRG